MREDTKVRMMQEAAVMQAYANGEDVQYQYPYSREWIMFYGEYFNFAEFDYRIKPVIKKSVGYRRYLRVFDNKEYVYIFHENSSISDAHLETTPDFIRWVDTEWQYEIV
jgi:hypothetical protein